MSNMVFMKVMFIIFLLQHLVLTSAAAFVGHHQPPRHSLLTDKAALLAFKRTITHDPNSTLSNWEEGVGVCNFTGIVCNKQHHRVVQLRLVGAELVGLLSPFISNLTGLHILELSNNQLFGVIPHEFSSLRHLRYLQLDGNYLHGSIPNSFAFLTNLTLIALMDNKLTDRLPPSFFANCTSLKNVDVSSNFLTGKFPEEIGNCPNLWNLNLSYNQFTGELPFSLTNASLMCNIDVANNGLSGELPLEIVRRLTSLQSLNLSYNNMKSHENNTNLDPFFNALANSTGLEELELGGMGLGGRFPDSIGQLGVYLKTLRLQENEIFGSIPPSIANLTGLHILELSYNQLFGVIPHEFSSLRHLRYLQLSGNNLHGSIPNSFAFLTNLTLIALMDNKLTGRLPPSFFANCTSLKNVDVSNNFLAGKIPEEIGNCPDIWNLNLYNNQFTGELPFSLTNASQMYNIDVENNCLSGELPLEIVQRLPLLQSLHLSYNNMTSHNNNTNLDPFFNALANCTGLVELELAGMGLGGRLPDSIGRFGFLETLHLQENKIFGSIPPSIANLFNLSVLNLTSNLLNGTISAEISLLPKLEQLFLSHNLFASEIPSALGQCPHLGLLDLSNNKFSGAIPETLGNLVRVNSLFLNNNLLSGRIPPTLGQCTDLYKLDLSHNRLTGSIPPEISGIREIRIFLNLSHNNLEGPLPIELSKLENVQEMDLSSNNLTGSIFPQISSCIALRMINFSQNSLEGHLPDSLGDLKNLESFDVSQNHLSGIIPISLNKIQTLAFLNLSFNNFEETIPSGGIFNSVTYMSFLHNPRLCGNVSGIPRCSSNWFHSHIILTIFVLVIFVSAFLSTICCVFGFRRIRAMITFGKTETVRKPTTPDLLHNFPRITYKELTEATGGFEDQRIIGSGSYGRVYKGVLGDGTAIAVKVLHLQTGNSTKSFNRECQVLKRIRHRNLIRIITACSLPDFKALVLPYMANGSLDSRLYPHSGTGLRSGSSDLSLIQRVNICSDIAEGMAYLHHHSPVKVIHCDLKPSNVLLNDDMTALVSDFGIARLVMSAGGGNAGVVENMGNSTANMLCGSIGYIAPGKTAPFASAYQIVQGFVGPPTPRFMETEILTPINNFSVPSYIRSIVDQFLRSNFNGKRRWQVVASEGRNGKQRRR